MINKQDIIDDEIDIMPFIIAILKNYKLFILASIVSIFIAFGLNETLTKKYRSSASFIIPNTLVASSAASGLLSINSIFNKTFSSQHESVYSTYLPAIVNSYRIKEYVAQKMIMQGIINEQDLINVDEENKINHIIGVFKLYKNISLEEDLETKVFFLKYSHENQAYILPILRAYINGLIELNETLNVDANRLELIELDYAKFPNSHYFPKFIYMYVFSLISFWMLISLIIVINKIIELKKL